MYTLISRGENNHGQSWPSDKILLQVIDGLDQVSSLELFLFGAHIVDWSVNGVERLWISSLSAMDGSAPIRGGIPIAFPQFADQGNHDS